MQDVLLKALSASARLQVYPNAKPSTRQALLTLTTRDLDDAAGDLEHPLTGVPDSIRTTAGQSLTALSTDVHRIQACLAASATPADPSCAATQLAKEYLAQTGATGKAVAALRPYSGLTDAQVAQTIQVAQALAVQEAGLAASASPSAPVSSPSQSVSPSGPARKSPLPRPTVSASRSR